MEILGLLELPVWLLAVCLPVVTFSLYSWYKQSFFKRRGLPTKPTTFILGDLPLMVKKGFGFIGVDEIKQHGKVFGTFTCNLPSLIVADPEMIKHIMVKEFPNFVNRPSMIPLGKRFKRLINWGEDEHWKMIRTCLSPSFTTGKMRPMCTYITRCLESLDTHLAEAGEANPGGFDIVPLIRNYTMDVILNVGFGIEVDAQSDPDNPCVKHAKGMLEFSPNNPFFLLFLLMPELSYVFQSFEFTFTPKESRLFYKNTAMSIMEDRKRQPQSSHKDLLQLMIDAQKKENDTSDGKSTSTELTDDDIIGNAIMFMLAGYDTTATTLSWLLYDLVVNTDCQEKLSQEIQQYIGQEAPTYDSVFGLQYLDMVFSETLRHHPVVARLNRKAAKDMEICGLPILAGIDISIPVNALHMLPEYWEEPTKYNPDRFAPENKGNIDQYAYMPFGHGPRNCIGMRLAMLEVKMTLVNILQRFKLLKTDHLKIPMPEKKGNLIMSPDAPIHVTVERRHRD